jgi:hypothetical protein
VISLHLIALESLAAKPSLARDHPSFPDQFETHEILRPAAASPRLFLDCNKRASSFSAAAFFSAVPSKERDFSVKEGVLQCLYIPSVLQFSF